MRKINKLFSKITAIAVILAAFCLVSSCRSGTEPDSLLDRNWGRAFETAKYNQTANPEAPEDLEPPSGIDGPAAESAVETYRGGFEGKKAPEVYKLKVDVGKAK